MNKNNDKIANDTAKVWCLKEFDDLEVIKAHYVNQRFTKHTHDTFVLGIIENGVQEFFCNGVVQFAPIGSIVIVNPGDIHTGSAAPGKTWSYRAMYPKSTLIADVFKNVPDNECQIPFFKNNVIRDPIIFSAFKALHLDFEQSDSQIAYESMLLQTLSLLVERHAEKKWKPAPKTSSNHAMKMIKELLIENSENNISINSLSEISGLSPFHLIHSFRKTFGIPPHQYLIQIRVEKAKKMLLQGVSLAQTAYESGFADQSHFTRQFKRIVGATPGQYL